MNPTILTFPTTKLIGQNLIFTYSDYRSFELCSKFMTRKNEIQNAISTDLFNIQINPENFDFNPNTSFVKWAAVPVSDFETIPNEMQTLEIQEGMYAVFHYKGDQNDAIYFFRKIYSEWLPNSNYVLDNRPQFEILGEKYKTNHPDSEENIYIPIKIKF